MNRLKLQDIGNEFNRLMAELDRELEERASSDMGTVRQSLCDTLTAYKQQEALSVAFVGQYSAGKSTLISALTGRRDIHIDADIATDTVTAYDWQGIKLVDTPGLFTDRPDHDEIGYDAIARADILVFCLTYMLFDSITLANFKTLAYDQGYQWKMLLVVNKLSAEAGEDIDDTMANYRQSLADALHPHDLSAFPLCFIDAKDYCDGIDDDIPEFVDSSRLDTFIAALNQFVQKNAIASRLDTPIRIALSHIDDAQTLVLRNDGEDAVFSETLSRLSRRVNRERRHLRTQVKSIMLELSGAMGNEAETLVAAVGKEDLTSLSDAAEASLNHLYEHITTRLDELLLQAEQDIKQVVDEELNSTLVQSFVAQLDVEPTLHIHNSPTQNHYKKLSHQVAWLEKIGQQVGGKVAKSATRGVFSTAGQGFLRATDVAGSNLHGAVYGVGKMIGFKFKPWQAVNAAKGLGNVAKILGPLAAAATVGVELLSMQQEAENQKKITAVQQEIRRTFNQMTRSLKQQIQEQLSQFEQQLYGEVEAMISGARQDQEEAIATSSSTINALAAIRHDLNRLLTMIQNPEHDSD